ncbi:MAG TPA: imidazole glycerol phosphate synthase subunit HisF [Dokdonella sp.]
MLARRLIPCLDVAGGAVVKGVRFRDHRVVGDVVELARRYADEGADELVFYDIAASPDGRSVDPAWVERVARELDIPFCVAGGIRSVETAEAVLAAGADKISINSPALARPALIDELAARFGRQCVVVGVDVDALADAETSWRVIANSGRPDAASDSGRDLLSWVRELDARGAGEIVLNAIRADGVRAGYAHAQVAAVRAATTLPLVASGGAGAPEHFADVFSRGADAALAASVFHSGEIRLGELKRFLAARGIVVRA